MQNSTFKIQLFNIKIKIIFHQTFTVYRLVVVIDTCLLAIIYCNKENHIQYTSTLYTRAVHQALARFGSMGQIFCIHFILSYFQPLYNLALWKFGQNSLDIHALHSTLLPLRRWTGRRASVSGGLQAGGEGARGPPGPSLASRRLRLFPRPVAGAREPVERDQCAMLYVEQNDFKHSEFRYLN